MIDLVMILAEQSGVDAATLSEWLEEELFVLSDDALNIEIVERVQRIRRLTALGVNLPGVETILYMRAEIIDYQTRLGLLGEELRRAKQQYEAEIARMVRELSIYRD